jgi:hypothetical protein
MLESLSTSVVWKEPTVSLPTLKPATIAPPKPGRVAEPNPWVDVLKNLPANPELEGWSIAQGFICPITDAKGHVSKIRAAGAALHIGVAVQVEDNTSEEPVKTDDKFTVKPTQSLVRFATRPRQVRKPKPEDVAQAAVSAVEANADASA